MQHLEREQALAKQFAEILHFTLSFDELKVKGDILGLITALRLTFTVLKNQYIPSVTSSLHHADDKSSHSEWLQLLQEDHKQEQAEQPAGEALGDVIRLRLFMLHTLSNVQLKQHGFTFTV